MRLTDTPFIIAGLLLIACLSLFFSQPTKIEAQSPKRFQIQTTEKIADYYNLMAICDTATGNLIYTGNDYRTGITVIPDGCQKNPR